MTTLCIPVHLPVFDFIREVAGGSRSVVVTGGYVRDAIADDPFVDVDIACEIGHRVDIKTELERRGIAYEDLTNDVYQGYRFRVHNTDVDFLVGMDIEDGVNLRADFDVNSLVADIYTGELRGCPDTLRVVEGIRARRAKMMGEDIRLTKARFEKLLRKGYVLDGSMPWEEEEEELFDHGSGSHYDPYAAAVMGRLPALRALLCRHGLVAMGADAHALVGAGQTAVDARAEDTTPIVLVTIRGEEGDVAAATDGLDHIESYEYEDGWSLDDVFEHGRPVYVWIFKYNPATFWSPFKFGYACVHHDGTVDMDEAAADLFAKRIVLVENPANVPYICAQTDWADVVVTNAPIPYFIRVGFSIQIDE